MQVEHDETGRRFYVTLQDGDAELIYDRFTEGVIDLQHTEVPRSGRGSGVADALVRAALAWAREHGERIIATCPYVQRWLETHPGERP